MKFRFVSGPSLGLLLWGLATATSAQSPARPFAPAATAISAADPAAPVPALLYRSVFSKTPTGVEASSDDWKKANAEVGQFRNGHVDILKWEQAQPTGQAPAPGMPDASSKRVSP